HGADREPAAERLGERHDVGRDAGVLVREETPRAPEAALDLVEDEEHVPPLGERAQPGQVVGRRDDDAALALDRLDHDGDRLVAHGGLHGGEVAVGDEADAGQQGEEARVVVLLPGGGEGREGAPVEGARGGEDLEAPAARVRVRRAVRGRISVPTPREVSTSSSTAWRTRPSITCACRTPPRIASRQHSTLGIMPPAMVPSRIMSAATSAGSVSMSAPSRLFTPSTSVSRMSFSARSASATLPATTSALML